MSNGNELPPSYPSPQKYDPFSPEDRNEKASDARPNSPTTDDVRTRDQRTVRSHLTENPQLKLSRNDPENRLPTKKTIKSRTARHANQTTTHEAVKKEAKKALSEWLKSPNTDANKQVELTKTLLSLRPKTAAKLIRRVCCRSAGIEQHEFTQKQSKELSNEIIQALNTHKHQHTELMPWIKDKFLPHMQTLSSQKPLQKAPADENTAVEPKQPQAKYQYAHSADETQQKSTMLELEPVDSNPTTSPQQVFRLSAQQITNTRNELKNSVNQQTIEQLMSKGFYFETDYQDGPMSTGYKFRHTSNGQTFSISTDSYQSLEQQISSELTRLSRENTYDKEVSEKLTRLDQNISFKKPPTTTMEKTIKALKTENIDPQTIVQLFHSGFYLEKDYPDYFNSHCYSFQNMSSNGSFSISTGNRKSLNDQILDELRNQGFLPPASARPAPEPTAKTSDQNFVESRSTDTEVSAMSTSTFPTNKPRGPISPSPQQLITTRNELNNVVSPQTIEQLISQGYYLERSENFRNEDHYLFRESNSGKEISISTEYPGSLDDQLRQELKSGGQGLTELSGMTAQPSAKPAPPISTTPPQRAIRPSPQQLMQTRRELSNVVSQPTIEQLITQGYYLERAENFRNEDHYLFREPNSGKEISISTEYPGSLDDQLRQELTR